MNFSEFFQKIPYALVHPAHGYSTLEIVENSPNMKHVCYRADGKWASYGTFGRTWDIVYIDLHAHLVKMGQIEK